MKKLFVALLACGFMFTISSCKKDFTCECTYNVSGSTVTTPYEYTDTKKQDAKDACAAQESLYKLTDSEASCKIK